MSSIINATTTAGVTVTGDNSGSLQLATNNGTTAVTIDTSQNVGIGTSSPSTYSAKLAVVASSGAANQWLVGGASSGAYAYFSNNAQSSSANTMQIGQGWASGSDNIGFLNTNGANPMLFATNGAERMRILSGGNVCIGTTSNIARIGAVFDGNTDNGCILRTSTNASGTGFLYFQQDTNSCGSVIRVGTTSAVTYSTTSDYRLKENITPMTGALSKVARLKPVTYTWKSGGESAEGFIAHELAEVCPDAVVGTKDQVETYLDDEGNEQTRIKPQGVDTSFLVATLTAAIQELKAELDATKAEVQALKGVA